MKSNVIIIAILSILGIGLFLSTQLDKKVNAYEIAMYQCKKNPFISFPVEYLKPEIQGNFNATKSQYQPKYNTSHKRELNWSNVGLTALPDNLFKNYPCINFFDISKNELKEIPTTIQDLKNIKQLNLQNNKITSTKNDNIDYKLLRHLDSINLSHNLIDTLDIIPLYRTFHSLDVSNNQIKHISAIDDFSLYLTILDISKNQLSEFPNHLSTIQNLMTLDISRNKINGKIELQEYNQLRNLNISNQLTDSVGITSIVLGKGNLDNLIRLEADSNNIMSFTVNNISFYESILQKLEFVSLKSNKLTVFPKLFYNCPNIRTIDLSDNKIGELIPFTELTPALQEFHLANIDKLGSIFFESLIPSLESLNLSNNKIQKFDKLFNIPKIQQLDLSFNQLTRFPFFDDNDLLIELDLSNNQINTLEYFTQGRMKIERIEKINLSNNQIKIFEESNNQYPSLKELDLSNNQITIFHCNGYPMLEKLNLSNNNLKKIIYNGNFASFLNIKELDLSNNPNLEDIPINMFNTSNKLRLINIKNTKIDANLLLFLTKYCKSNNIKLIK